MSAAVWPGKMRHMKLASVLLASVTLLGCQNESKVGGVGSGNTTPTPTATGTSAPPISGDLEARVRRLEELQAKYGPALDFLQEAYNQQKAQIEERERSEPAPDATFAVDIATDVKGGQVEGPATACVTLVEAWDFA